MRALIDTNVILDALMGREPFRRAAEEIILLAASEKITACITASSVTDLYYILHKSLRDRERAKQAIRGTIAIVSVLDVTAIDCEKAFDLSMPDYEDALQVQCAKRHKVDCIISRDLRHFAGSPVKAVLPDDFLRSFRQRF